MDERGSALLTKTLNDPRIIYNTPDPQTLLLKVLRMLKAAYASWIVETRIFQKVT
jgi:hypothetical protein